MDTLIRRARCVVCALFSTLALMRGVIAQPVEVQPGSELTVEIPAGSAQQFSVTLPVGKAADIQIIQRAGFVDFELRDEGNLALKVRTESGILGRIDAPMLASKASSWLVIVSPRKGKGVGAVGLHLSQLRDETAGSRVCLCGGWRWVRCAAHADRPFTDGSFAGSLRRREIDG